MLSEERLQLLEQIAHGIAAQFGPSCEVAIHDLTGTDPEHTVVYIENGKVTGRTVGSSPSHVVLGLMNGEMPAEDRLAYLTRTPGGKILKSSSLFIRDGAGRPEALFAINYDISPLLTVESALHGLTASQPTQEKEPERITGSVTALLDELIEESVALIGRPVALMDREDKVRAIRFLSDNGALLITKAGDKIAHYFGISKYTLYSYLDTDK